MNKTRNGGRRIPRRPKLPQLNMQFTANPQFCPEVSSTKFNQSNYSSNSSPGCSSPVKIHDDCNIFLGSEQDALDKNFINSQKISTILSIQSWEIQEKIQGIKYHFVEAKDNSEMDLKSKFEPICNFLKQHENERVLVHCQAGISRSATACLAYLMKEKHMSLDSSFIELKKRREIVCPNFSFLGQLKCWEREIMVQ
jgi:protein-tyrosine phosphatase